MIEKEAESTYIEMASKNRKHIILGSIYRSPNTCKKQLKVHITDVNSKIRSEKGKKELVLGMDHNMDLLKGHEHQKTQQFLDMMLDLDLLLIITRPTRITQSSATLIDNVFISSVLQRLLDFLIIMEDTSDHFPSLVLMKQTKLRDKNPLCFESRSLTDAKLDLVKNDLKTYDWNGLLRSDDVNENFEKFCIVLNTTLDKVAPIKNVRISWKRKYSELWMTKGIKHASNKCKRLYTDSNK